MESVSCKWLLLPFLFLSWEHSAFCAVDGVKGGKVRGVSLGNWLVIEGWMKPSLFDGIQNGDMLDGTKVRFRSVSLNKYVSATDGGGSSVFANQAVASNWETFRLWRVSESRYQIRAEKGQFLSCTGHGASVTATSVSPNLTETFTIERSSNDRVRIKHSSGTYLQVSSGNELKANYVGTPGFDDDEVAIFVMTLNDRMQGEYQLSNGYGPEKAKEVLTQHRKSYITKDNFQYLSKHSINTVRIPVGWWIAKDPNPPAPYVGGSLAALDNAFQWAQEFGIKCIINLHAAPGSQNGKDHSSGRDDSIDWTEPENIQQSLDTIRFLATKYGNHPALLGIDLLNNPEVPFDTLKKYYKDGYDVVRKHSPTAYVIMCQLNGNGSGNPVDQDLYEANTGKSNVVLDLHYYNIGGSFENMSALQHVNYINNNSKTQLDSLKAADGPLVFIGEWTNAFGKGEYSQKEYQKFGRAQLNVYGSASFGWAYWTLKNVGDHWSFEWNIDNNYLQLAAPVTAVWKIVVPVFIVVSAIVCVLGYIFLFKRKKTPERGGLKGLQGVLTDLSKSKAATYNDTSITNSFEDGITEGETRELQIYSFSCLSNATNNFSWKNKLGEGGFGPVYKGKLLNEQEIAVKRLSKNSGQGIEEFKNEVVLISKLQHRNLVKLLGCCFEGEEYMLIYEFMPKSSLDAFLFGPNRKARLDWDKRFNIIGGIARGLLYLHRDSRLRVIHRDLKASNILLDDNMTPKISDFGMARIFGGDQLIAETNRVVGTFGYMSPEYIMGGTFSEKSDVFSFGVLILEIVSSKRNNSFYNPEKPSNLLLHTWRLWNEGKWSEIVDEDLGDLYSPLEVKKCVHIGLLCVQNRAIDRPTMAEVDLMLISETDRPFPKEPPYSFPASSDKTGSKPVSCSSNDVTFTAIEGR